MSVKVVYEDVAVGSAAAASVTASEAMGISKTSLLPFRGIRGASGNDGAESMGAERHTKSKACF